MKLALLILAAVLPAAADWRLVGQTKAERFYVSDARTDREGDRVRRWEKAEPATEARRLEYVELLSRLTTREKAAHFSHDLTRREYDCPGGAARMLAQLYQDKDGGRIYATPDEDLGRWRSPVPDSAEETLMLDACKGAPAESQ
jgi:hypothetical protein